MPKPQKVYMFCLRLLFFFSAPPDEHLEILVNCLMLCERINIKPLITI